MFAFRFCLHNLSSLWLLASPFLGRRHSFSARHCINMNIGSTGKRSPEENSPVFFFFFPIGSTWVKNQEFGKGSSEQKALFESISCFLNLTILYQLYLNNIATLLVLKMSHSFENFMGNKGFHPASWNNQKKVFCLAR